MKRWMWILLAIIIIAAAAIYLGPIRSQSLAAQTQYQTAPAGRGSLTATVGATGLVRANQTALLSWQTSGTVGSILAAVGEQVSAGEELAVLEQTSLPQSVILAQADLVSAQKALDDLLNSRLQQARAQQAVEDAEQALEDAQKPELGQARALEAIATAQKGLETAERTLRNILSTADDLTVDEARSQVALADDALKDARERYEPYENKPENNLTRARLLAEYANAQQQYDLAVRNLNALLGVASDTDQAIAQANVEKARAQLAQAQRDYERIKDGASPADIALLQAQLEDARREAERLKDGPDPDDIAAAQARVAAAQASLDQAHLLAPFAGTLTEVNAKLGDQVAPGVLAFRLDDLARLLVDVQVSEVDINRIQPGQAVSLLFDAILSREYQGEVREVALVGTASQGVVDFNVTVEITNPDLAVKPGMTAAVNIVVDQLDDVLLVPNRAVRVVEGERVVYLLRDGQPEPVQIELGASSETSSEVTGGELKEGDPIVLNPPTVFDQNGPPPFVRRGQ
jgi:HlyD family secretion protein